MNNVLYQHGLMGLTTPGEWVRPVDWLPMPATVANSIDILAAVFDHDSNYCAVNISVSAGTYSVDWGDGTTSTGVASNVQADHVYTYSALAGTDSAQGYRQALIRITPATGSITAVRLNVKHTQAGLVNGVSAPWLDVAINAPSATSVAMYSSSSTAALVQRIKLISIGDVTALENSFAACYSLVSVVFPAGSLAQLTTLANAFSACFSLRSVVFPAGSLARLTTLANSFNACYSLRSVVFPAGSLAQLTTLSTTFNACSSLQSVAFPAGSLALVTTLSGTFSNCPALHSVVFPAGSLALVTTLASAFASCSSLQSVAFPAGSLALVTTTTSCFAGNLTLSEVDNCGLQNTFSVASCRLSGASLNAIFTSLPTVTGKTITVTGNHGVPDCTPSIATSKGWTVIT